MLSNIRWFPLALTAALGALSPALRAEPAKAVPPRAGAATNPQRSRKMTRRCSRKRTPFRSI